MKLAIPKNRWGHSKLCPGNPMNKLKRSGVEIKAPMIPTIEKPNGILFLNFFKSDDYETQNEDGNPEIQSFRIRYARMD